MQRRTGENKGLGTVKNQDSTTVSFSGAFPQLVDVHLCASRYGGQPSRVARRRGLPTVAASEASVRRRLAERMGFEPASPAPINNLRAFSIAQIARNAQNLSIRYKTLTAATTSFSRPLDRLMGIPFDRRRMQSCRNFFRNGESRPTAASMRRAPSDSCLLRHVALNLWATGWVLRRRPSRDPADGSHDLSGRP